LAYERRIHMERTETGRKLLEAGHSCQNLYLASGAIGAGMCAIGAYNQEELDGLLKVDGTDEFTIYAGVVGKIKAKE